MDDTITIHYTSTADPTTTTDDLFPSDTTIISLCNIHKNTNDASDHPLTTTLKLNNKTLVKYLNVSISECHNQVFAYNVLTTPNLGNNSNLITVPKPLRCFSSARTGFVYLVMEFVDGEIREIVDDEKSIETIAKAVRYLQTFSSDVPGPLGGKKDTAPRGLFWENENVRGGLRTIKRLEEFVNRRLLVSCCRPSPESKEQQKHERQQQQMQSWKLGKGKLVLNHNDIAPRNILWMKDGGICLLDWAHAGFYPKMLEVAVLGINNGNDQDAVFAERLERMLGPFGQEEEKEVQMFRLAWFNGHRYRV
jgi:serine/threonine protein kinase